MAERVQPKLASCRSRASHHHVTDHWRISFEDDRWWFSSLGSTTSRNYRWWSERETERSRWEREGVIYRRWRGVCQCLWHLFHRCFHLAMRREEIRHRSIEKCQVWTTAGWLVSRDIRMQHTTHFPPPTWLCPDRSKSVAGDGARYSSMSRRRCCSRSQWRSITDVSEVNDCWATGVGKSDDWLDGGRAGMILGWSRDGTGEAIGGRSRSVEKIVRRAGASGDVWDSFICWQSKLKAERLFNGRIWTTSTSSGCSRWINVASVCRGETAVEIIERWWVGGRPIGKKLWLCSSSSSSDQIMEAWTCGWSSKEPLLTISKDKTLFSAFKSSVITYLTCEITRGDFSTGRNSVVVLKVGKAGGGDGVEDFSTMVDNTVGGAGGGDEGGLVKKSFDVSSRWLALLISSWASRTWSLCMERTSVTFSPLLINGRPLRDSGNCSRKSVWIVVLVERVVSISGRWAFICDVKFKGRTLDGGGTLAHRAVLTAEVLADATSEPV